MVTVCDLFQSRIEFLKLWKHRIISSSPVRILRERMLYIIFPGQSSLLQHHIGEENDIILLAVVQNSGSFRRTVQKTVMVLDRRDLQPLLCKDVSCFFDLRQTVV